MRVPALRCMGCGVTISNPSSGGVMRSRLDASAKKAKTWSRGSGRRIEVVSVCIIGGAAFQETCFRRRCGSMILVHGRCQPRSLDAGTMGRTSAVSLPCSRMLWLSLQGPRRVLEHNPIPIEILERLTLGFPIRVIRGDTLKPGCEHL